MQIGRQGRATDGADPEEHRVLGRQVRGGGRDDHRLAPSERRHDARTAHRCRSVDRVGPPMVLIPKSTESLAARFVVEVATIIVWPRASGVTTPEPLTDADR